MPTEKQTPERKLNLQALGLILCFCETFHHMKASSPLSSTEYQQSLVTVPVVNTIRVVQFKEPLKTFKVPLKPLLCIQFTINKSNTFDLKPLYLVVLYPHWCWKPSIVLCYEKGNPETQHNTYLKKTTVFHGKGLIPK